MLSPARGTGWIEPMLLGGVPGQNHPYLSSIKQGVWDYFYS